MLVTSGDCDTTLQLKLHISNKIDECTMKTLHKALTTTQDLFKALLLFRARRKCTFCVVAKCQYHYGEKHDDKL